MKNGGSARAAAMPCSAIMSGDTGRAGDIVGVCMPPVRAHEMMTFSDCRDIGMPPYGCRHSVVVKERGDLLLVRGRKSSDRAEDES
jgi:hypothetical protein